MAFKPFRFLKRALGLLVAAQDTQLGELAGIKDRIDDGLDGLGDRIQKEVSEEVDKLRDRLLGGHEREEVLAKFKELEDELKRIATALEALQARAGNA